MAALGFAAGASLVARWPRTTGARWVAAFEPASEIDSSLPDLFGISIWVAIGVGLALIVALLVLFGHVAPADRHWPWMVTGLSLGALGVLAWLTGAWSDWNWGLSITGPARSLVDVLLFGRLDAANWGTAMLIGLPIGAWASARAQGPVSWRMPARAELGQRLAGGLLMGIGGTLTAGCNIGNALTGLSILAVNSIIATVGIFVGGALAIQIGTSRSFRIVRTAGPAPPRAPAAAAETADSGTPP